ncbi:HNH endonuclease [Paenibacillus polymyxa]|uniref:HNH endonuclease n=1 Tax=Paenibacillus polymyxa TaxID=1406 RepID=UPI0025B71346|nr:HNH endonuclease [Paenibacillus polymyxa]MDN4106128.1 HNH endonuclease [Paenibacillus polymyxa]
MITGQEYRNRLCTRGETTYVPGGSLRTVVYKSCGCKRVAKRNKGAANHIKTDAVDGTHKSALKAKLHKDNKSGVKGVRFNEQRQKWTAHIEFKDKQINLGYHSERIVAINARKRGEEKYLNLIIEKSTPDRHDQMKPKSR